MKTARCVGRARAWPAWAEADDLAVRAARLLQDEAKGAQGADIIVEKHVPAGGGFGGGSSDAATVLVVLNRLWRAGLDEDALAALALRLGADVPVFVRGRNAWAEGVGERLQPITLAPAGMWWLNRVFMFLRRSCLQTRI